MNKNIQKLLILFVTIFVVVHYAATKMEQVPQELEITRIILLILVVTTSFGFTISYDREPKEKKDKDEPKNLTKNLAVLYIVLTVFYGLFKLRGLVWTDRKDRDFRKLILRVFRRNKKGYEVECPYLFYFLF